ncbi:hypothetical protein LYNGBM3L_41850 [Moorena producens 3L]|uniref:Uncharacterized protein n=1 Tax=Moorena producens 3L TaxID=489825 RepID=F4XW27_9CYAN|nr:hypothetical protein LYNGBM3L_41850 [Moorena producens 3L]OLT64692.1 hypothetical protein BI334_06275 [Moorena producens 3L]
MSGVSFNSSYNTSLIEKIKIGHVREQGAGNRYKSVLSVERVGSKSTAVVSTISDYVNIRIVRKSGRKRVGIKVW